MVPILICNTALKHIGVQIEEGPHKAHIPHIVTFSEMRTDSQNINNVLYFKVMLQIHRRVAQETKSKHPQLCQDEVLYFAI